MDSLAEILMIKSSQISSIDRAPEFWEVFFLTEASVRAGKPLSDKLTMLINDITIATKKSQYASYSQTPCLKNCRYVLPLERLFSFFKVYRMQPSSSSSSSVPSPQKKRKKVSINEESGGSDEDQKPCNAILYLAHYPSNALMAIPRLWTSRFGQQSPIG